jgi:hypothetical protein
VIKQSRYYQVLTSELALGVDTLVSVTAGSSSWSNDDYAAPGSGNYASAVCFQAPLDGSAIATITNKALQYGGDKTYKVKVSEVASLTASPCITSTSLLQPRKAPGLSALARPSGPLQASRYAPQLALPTFEFVIVAELKVVAP